VPAVGDLGVQPPANCQPVECRRMFGQPDYLIRVAVADPVAYEALYMNELAPITGVGRVNSQFTMKLVKSTADFTA
jgi:Lrp/AsnC family transcriptional regulator, leucine-responsive regulatory protein